MGKTSYQPKNKRRILFVFPKYTPSFGTFHHAYSLVKGVKAFMPPQGILVVAAYFPNQWEVRFIDENIQPAKAKDYQWADAVIVSGMHIQRPQINYINREAHKFGKITVLGGPSVSACPEYYPDFDILHLGELGDATDRIIEYLDHHTKRPERQLVFTTQQRLPLNQFPIPAYHLINPENYFLGNIQFSSGCPYRCEFCDIPVLYGNSPRLKTPQQIIAELDAILSRGNPGAIYFVDDNFVANRRATMELLPHLIEWQQKNGYPIQFACEATLNLAQSPKLLELMREAYFCTVFCGIETPDAFTLKAISKQHNLGMPILEAINVLNSYGMEVVSGIIIGFDTDTPQTADNILEFIRLSHIPMLTINLLYALPKTPLWYRLKAEGRIIEDDSRESNIDFLMPYEEVLNIWKRCIATAYEPEFLYERFAYQAQHTYPNRITPPNSPQRVSWKNIQKGLQTLMNLFWHIGIKSDYRKTFWQMAIPLLRRLDIETLIHIALVSHHLIQFTRECTGGEQAASFYSQKQKQTTPISSH
ncbi:MAG: B12-binding domain-containing radical SAM protein [Geminocystis sp.]|nr:B12-binding domain-containing radical SAM protein [Geminocystis sp.]MCS7148181.1 B12-binding domain-containing radical SAM protein [Geminocystis sp.]MCX8077594.1 B12-binding domain-containing radical SAM protein [Geminocystis sp.]MDW8462334.1 B12-binding domain-containing radical SAM protein [Geminocystis sp.]HIK36537.1 B12-binding domain-containing radical SAM protein [Geminocystis sp. M7585_C2015_104]